MNRQFFYFKNKINNIFIPESFDTNISYQLFDHTITFVNPQHKNTNSKGVFVLKTGLYCINVAIVTLSIILHYLVLPKNSEKKMTTTLRIYQY